jgi:uncharacterized protein (DUF362 family)
MDVEISRDNLNIHECIETVVRRMGLSSADEVLKNLRNTFTHDDDLDDHLLDSLRNCILDMFMIRYGYERLERTRSESKGNETELTPYDPFIARSTRPGFSGIVIDASLDVSQWLDTADISNQFILLKPNFVSSEPFPTTSKLDFVTDIIEHLLDNKPRCIQILDSPSFFEPYVIEVITELCGLFLEQDIIEIVRPTAFDGRIYGPSQNPALAYHHIVPSKLFFADRIISVSTLKQHEGFGFSATLKNLLGCLPDCEKLQLHSLPKPQALRFLLDLDVLFPVSHAVIDARKTLLNAQQQSRGGSIANGIGVLSGYDPIGLDLYAISLWSATNREVEITDSYFSMMDKNAIQKFAKRNTK